MSQIPLRNTRVIEFGKTITDTSPEMLKLYGMYVYNDNNYFGNTNGVLSGHNLGLMLEAAYTTLNDVRDENFTLTGTTATLGMGMMNIGRLARLKLTGRGLAFILCNWESELNRNISGTVCGTKTATNVLADMFYVSGQELQSFLGSWNKVKYRPADDILAGAWMVLFNCLFFLTGHYMSVHYLWKQIGQYSVLDGILRGNYVAFNPSDETTHGSVLCSKENFELDNISTPTWKATGHNLFGVDVSTIDNAEFRKIDVPIYSPAVAFWQRFLSKTRWDWKYAKYIEVQPLFSLWNAETTQDGSIYQDWVDYFTMNNVTDKNQWAFLLQRTIEIVMEFKNFRFQSDAFGKLKSLINLVPFSNIPDLSIGPGGLIMHQMAYWEDGGALSTDTMCHKFYIDDDTVGHQCLALRRETDNVYDFITLGDMDLRDYRIHHFLCANTIYNEDSTSDQVIHTSYASVIDIKGFYGFAIKKSEEKPYELSRYMHSLVAASTYDVSIGNTNPLMIKTWKLFSDISGNERTTDFTIGLNYSKHGYYYWRAADPYKKVAHNVHDINNLDLELVMRDVVSTIFPIGSAQIVKDTPIITSALPEIEKKDTTEVIPVSAMEEKKDDESKDKVV